MPPLRPARFLRRENRFVVIAEDEASGVLFRAHLGDPGRLETVLVPGGRVWVAVRHPSVAGGSPAREERRAGSSGEEAPGKEAGFPAPSGASAPGRSVGPRTTHRAVLAEPEPGRFVAVVPTLAERVIEAVLRSAILSVPGAVLRRQARWKRHRFDFRLDAPEAPPLWIEVKAVTLRDGALGRFPDAVTERGRRHLAALQERAASGEAGVLWFVALRGDVAGVAPAEAIDPAFAAELRAAARSGVFIRAIGTRPSPEAVALAGALPVLLEG
ncbi:DNA/RNA nuclease SfsA [Hydrogenibacillus schlegelii]|uniref:DNA/RNA nuclease SfsA n=1 Tax=Hydrogenibacillus schlegelii TaxID=1484 RepID=UPI002357C1A3|nr:DNA/RNA nuclease SfsA [Hydrogenibacillus schlegelii]